MGQSHRGALVRPLWGGESLSVLSAAKDPRRARHEERARLTQHRSHTRLLETCTTCATRTNDRGFQDD